MILEKQTEALVQQEGTSQDSIGMSLDLDSAQILMQMLSKNLYSDSVGSTVRECASNALDSHRRAGVDKPIVVSFGRNDNNNYEFSVEDFGIGLDADDVKNIISKYGKSTKRNSATELGMMGLGFKAPLAYTSSFYFVCRKDGMERKYMMYEGEDTNTIDLLYEKATTEANGVKVIVPVNYYDRNDFQTKIRQQLAYFENVYFNIDDFDNNFSIVRSEHFQWSPLASDGKLHICLDNVYYPIEFDKLGIDNLFFPVGLRFSLTDGIFPTPNRESIRYTKEAKEIILKKLESVANYFVEKYNETITDTDNITEVMAFYGDDDKKLKIFGGSLDVKCLGQFATIAFDIPKLKGVSLIDMSKMYRNRDYILGEYEIRYRIASGKWRENKQSYAKKIKMYHFDTEKCYMYSERISGKMKDYLKSLHASRGWSNEINIIKKVNSFKLGSLRRQNEYDTYMQLLDLAKHPKSSWRDRIKEFQYVVSLYIKDIRIVEDVEIPQAWLDAQKKTKVSISSGPTVRRVKLQGEIVGKQAARLERWVEGKNSKLVPTTYQLETLHKSPWLTVYGSQSEADVKLMDSLFKITYGLKKTSIRFIAFSERELKNLEKIELHNWMKLETFMQGKNKPFKRIVTAYLIKELMYTCGDTFRKKEKMRDISEDLVNKLETLALYKDDHYIDSHDEIYAAMLTLANEQNLFDGEIYPVYKEVKRFLERCPFVETILDAVAYYSDSKMMDVMRDMLKYHRQRLDWKNYNIKLNEEVPTELTEETVEILLED